MVKKNNKLAIKLGLEREDDFVAFEQLPSVKLLSRISKKEQTREMVLKAISSIDINNSHEKRPALKYVSKRLIDFEICKFAVEKDWYNISYVPDNLKTHELCMTAIKASGFALCYIPDNMKTLEMCMLAVQNYYNSFKYVPKNLQTKEIRLIYRKGRKAHFEKEQIEAPIVQTNDNSNVMPVAEAKNNTYDSNQEDRIVCAQQPIALEVREEQVKNSLNVINKPFVYDIATTEDTQMIYYISDIHLEHQLQIVGKTRGEVKRILERRIKSLIKTANDNKGLLLVGGDVASSIELTKLFYDILDEYWDGLIIALLGNHELWDFGIINSGLDYDIDSLINKYKGLLWYVYVLENELLINYKNNDWKKVSERDILDAKEDELRWLLNDSTFVILGGVGFSGLNKKYNALSGIYRDSVKPDEDVKRTNRFKAVYDKIMRCAKDKQIIVFTHTQKENWTTDPYNPNWIYINGHTHRNTLIKEADGTKVFSDNQVGYKPKRWYLKGICLDKCFYDPLEDYPDGIYTITSDQYEDFNYGRGIYMSQFKRSEKIIALKRKGIYMFFAKGKNLYYLQGGRIYLADHDLYYYYENIEQYYNIIQNYYKPYYSALENISKEIKLIGGHGTIHGCIVDIDFYNHIYLNPYDGKITVYYAENIIDKIVFSSIEDLLINSPNAPDICSKRIKGVIDKGLLPILSHKKGIVKEAALPKAVFDTSMYKSSRISRSLQYVVENKVIRIWNDSVLEENQKKKLSGK